MRWTVVGRTQVRQPDLGGHAVTAGCQRLGRREIAEVAVLPQDAPLQEVRVRAVLKHLDIVVRFQNQQVVVTELALHLARDVPEIGRDGHRGGVRGDLEPDRLVGVVRDTANGSTSTSPIWNGRSASIGAGVLASRSEAQPSVPARGEDRHAVRVRQLPCRARVIAVIVGQQDAVRSCGEMPSCFRKLVIRLSGMPHSSRSVVPSERSRYAFPELPLAIDQIPW